MPKDPDWLTWPEAALLVGCPVPTIDWHTRTGRIEKRPFQGPRPTLKRQSVEDFAKWYHDCRLRRSAKGSPRRGSSTRQPPAPTGWVDAKGAAGVLGVSHGHIAYLVKTGVLQGVMQSGRWWIQEDELPVLAVERRRWISIADAAAIVGCSQRTIENAARRGDIVQRQAGRSQPSMDRDSVAAFAERYRAQQRQQQRERRERERVAALGGKPDDDHVWLSEDEVAVCLRITRRRVGQLAAADRLPFTRIGRRRWYRREHIELISAARAAAQTRLGQA